MGGRATNYREFDLRPRSGAHLLPALPFGASFAAGRRAAAFGRVARLLVGERLLGLIVVGLATLLGRFWP